MNALRIPHTTYVILCIVLVAATTSDLSAQEISSARGLSIGALTARSNDLQSIDWNPAGLSLVDDWEVSTTNFGTLASAGKKHSFSFDGVYFQNFGVAKRIYDVHSFAVRYAPGRIFEADIPSVFYYYQALASSSDSVRVPYSYSKKVQYTERYSLGYSYLATGNLSVGFAARYLEQRVDDAILTEKSIAGTRTKDISSEPVEYIANSWNVDVGLQWQLSPRFWLGIVGKNIFKIDAQKSAPVQGASDIRDLYKIEKAVRLGFGYAARKNLSIGLDIDTRGAFAGGYEWNITNALALRQGFTSRPDGGSAITATSVGIGYNFSVLTLDLGYLHYFQQDFRNGKAAASEFLGSGITDIEYNRFASDRLAISLHATLGQVRTALAKLEYVNILSPEVYPSHYLSYAEKPVGIARVRNISNRPIAARVMFFIDRYMDAPTQSEIVTIAPQSVAEIPFSAMFNPVITTIPSMLLCEGIVTVRSSAAEYNDDQAPVRVIIYGKNDWDGKVGTLGSFVKPEDPDVMFFTRSVLSANKDSVVAAPKQLERFIKARILFNEFSRRMTYVNDPRLSKDYVQYPNETFTLKGGDCDDMTVVFSSILESIGIPTAFVDVVPPEDPGNSHVYLAFDTGLKPEYARLLSENDKRFIIRQSASGTESVWIPVETTMLSSGFDAAWEKAAGEYLQEARLNEGLAKGWVKIVNVVSQ